MSELEVVVLVDLADDLAELTYPTYELKIQFRLSREDTAQDLPVKDFVEALRNAGRDVAHHRVALSDADKFVDTSTDADIGFAVFGLGAFVQYRLDDGMREEDLYSFMQAYLNLTGKREGLGYRDLHELRSQTIIVGPAEQEAIRQWWPSWLPDGEKLRLHRRHERNSLHNNVLDEGEAGWDGA